MLRAVDLFCGAGGTSQGAEQSGAARVVCAVNHWNIAVETHSANFPHARHINSRLDQVNPGECPRINLLFASPECIHHSRARGGRPTNDQARSGAWDIMRWVEHHRPQWLVIENVAEFKSWGPVGDDGRPLKRYQGRFFHAWVEAIRAAGYRVDDRLLNAADYGAATSRTRLFVVARKGGGRIHWPDPSHSRHVGGELPGFGLKPWRAAADIIDWSIPCKSVFSRKHPLKDKTLLRIESGLRKFVSPCLVRVAHGADSWGHGPSDLSRPLPTLTTSKDFGLAVPFLSAFHNGSDGHQRNYALGNSIPTLDTQNRYGIAAPFVYQLTHGGRTATVDRPLPTITTANRGETGIVVPFVLTYYQNGRAYPVTDPLGTLTTHDRCALGYAVIQAAVSIEPRTEGERKLYATMLELGVADVGFRMLANHELSAAQGFPASYIFHGNKGDVTRQIGNSVSPNVAQAITEAIAA